VLPADRLAKRFPGWKGGWFDRLARNDFPPGAEVATRRWKPMTSVEKTVVASGAGVISTPAGAVLWLSPAGPGAAVFSLQPSALTQLGVSVRDFVEREVAQLLGKPTQPMSLAIPAGAKELVQSRRALERLRKSQPPASVTQADLVSGVMVEGFRDAQALVSMTKTATDAGADCFFGFGDAENADDMTLREHPWLVGRSLAHTRGRAALKAVSMRTDSKSALFLVARGGLARASLFAGSKRLVTTLDFVKLTAKHVSAATHLVAETDG